MSKLTNIRVVGARLFFLPIQTRMPLKFGTETVTSVTCARAAITVTDAHGRRAEGWGETPLSVTWVWPSARPYEPRHAALKEFTTRLARAWVEVKSEGHPIELGHDFQEQILPGLLEEFNREHTGDPMPWLAALVCSSPFDLALHDAYGHSVGRPVYETYGPGFMNRDLASYLQPAPGTNVTFAGQFPEQFLSQTPPARLRAWHLVGGLDPLEASESTGAKPQDNYPVLLRDWIRRDGLKCLKVKLRGKDADWDYRRLEKVGAIAVEEGAEWLTADFNCTVTEPEYVNS